LIARRSRERREPSLLGDRLFSSIGLLDVVPLYQMIKDDSFMVRWRSLKRVTIVPMQMSAGGDVLVMERAGASH
jgi:hypothetical protein